eukprot:3612924-Amphidinium_carterae.1
MRVASCLDTQSYVLNGRAFQMHSMLEGILAGRRAATALMTVDSDGRLHRERPSADAELAGLANSTPTAAFADHTARDDAGALHVKDLASK